jgi:hypothetical protein
VVIGVGAVPAMDEVGTDETGATGDEDGFRHKDSPQRYAGHGGKARRKEKEGEELESAKFSR